MRFGYLSTFFSNVNILYYKKVLLTSHNIKYNETEIFALQNTRRKKTRTLKHYNSINVIKVSSLKERTKILYFFKKVLTKYKKRYNISTTKTNNNSQNKNSQRVVKMIKVKTEIKLKKAEITAIERHPVPVLGKDYGVKIIYKNIKIAELGCRRYNYQNITSK